METGEWQMVNFHFPFRKPTPAPEKLAEGQRLSESPMIPVVNMPANIADRRFAHGS
jgi:hypothetical protein